MRVLITGFGVFANNTENPTETLITSISEMNDPALVLGVDDVAHTRPCAIDVEILPVEYRAARERLEQLGAYDLHVALGLAADRTKITIERFAINKQDSRTADMSGHIARNESIDDGALALETSFDVPALVEAARQAGFDVEESLSAGLYVCNTVYYTALQVSRSAVFVHIPSPEYSSLETNLDFIRWIVRKLLSEIF
ncbi:hypothetical protein [Arcanobacterium bovis]|uniref:Pyrrolidone-carboxylate peptidase n=1 Tax=Arcanobacterium bovis TaxID=2529275 RepID=A0A4Q9V1I3_9ACTO|nr:hypothetical protein [Arcanobacterium bovis]TBW22956.1 hypothetical protein EZJ44_03445 [Arcanobacterium bovis]